MNAILGTTVEFDYDSSTAKDKKPLIFFLSTVGELVHALNIHYLTPSEKTYYHFKLKTELYDKISSGKVEADYFYKKFIKGKILSDAYRTYRLDLIKNPRIVSVNSRGQEAENSLEDLDSSEALFRGEEVEFLMNSGGEIKWDAGKISGKSKTGKTFFVENKAGKIVTRETKDIKRKK